MFTLEFPLVETLLKGVLLFTCLGICTVHTRLPTVVDVLYRRVMAHRRQAISCHRPLICNQQRYNSSKLKQLRAPGYENRSVYTDPILNIGYSRKSLAKLLFLAQCLI